MMSDGKQVIVAGLGEVGQPVFELVSSRYATIGIDVNDRSEPVDASEVLHICYPFQIADFVGETARYIERFKPALTIIHSTVAVGTARAVAARAGRPVVSSPVRGKHARMLEDLRRYTKFVGAIDADSGRRAAAHLESIGLTTRILPSPEATELAKLTETTYFGLLIAWAQEIERYCDAVNVPYEQVIPFYREIDYLPRVDYSPGVIGGHCVMPNIEILRQAFDSDILEAIRRSNRAKNLREARTRMERAPHASEAGASTDAAVVS